MPAGRPRTEFRDLEPIERRVAMMRVAGMSDSTISHFLDTNAVLVSNIVKRPRVARYMIALESTFIDDISRSSKLLDEAIMHEASRAFQVERQVMERLFEKDNSIRAQLGAAATAQDILDRAGKRAPTKVLAEVVHTIDAEALELVADVLAEAQAIDITPKGGTNGSSQESDAYEQEDQPDGVAGEETTDQGAETVHRDGQEPGDEGSPEDKGSDVA